MKKELEVLQETLIKYEEIVHSFKSKRAFTGPLLATFNIGFLTMRLRGFLYKRSSRSGIKYHWKSWNIVILQLWSMLASPGVLVKNPDFLSQSTPLQPQDYFIRWNQIRKALDHISGTNIIKDTFRGGIKPTTPFPMGRAHSSPQFAHSGTALWPLGLAQERTAPQVGPVGFSILRTWTWNSAMLIISTKYWTGRMGRHASSGVAIFCLMSAEAKKASPLRKWSSVPEKN